MVKSEHGAQLLEYANDGIFGRDRMRGSSNSCDSKRVLGLCRLPRFGRRGSGTIRLRCQSRIGHVECGRIIL